MLINCVAYESGRKLADIRLEEISDYLARRGCFVWVALRDPSDEELAKMQVEFNLPGLAIEDAVHGNQRPKIEEYGDIVHAVMHLIEFEPTDDLRVGEVHAYVGPNFVLSVRKHSTQNLMGVRARTEREPELLNAVVPLMDAAGKLYGGRVPLVCAKSGDYFRDVADHLTRMNAVIDTIRDTIGTAIQVNLSMVTIEESETTKQLAAWAGIFAVATAFAGIWGMNFEHMPELHWTYGYPASLAAITATCVLLYRRFRRVGWL